MNICTNLITSGCLLVAVGLHDGPAAAQQAVVQPPGTAAAGPSIPATVAQKLGKDLADLQRDIQDAQRSTAGIKFSRQLEVTSGQATVLTGARPSAPKAFNVDKGTTLSVIDRVGEFYSVVDQRGDTGWINAGEVKPVASKADYSFGYFPKQQDTPSMMDSFSLTSVPVGSSVGASGSMLDVLYQNMMEQAVKFRDSYKNNQYLSVSGFTVHVGVAPSLDLVFSFK